MNGRLPAAASLMTDDQAPANPQCLLFNGAVVPWNEAHVHIWSEVAVRGANVFEGIRGYWHPETERLYILALQPHLERLARSAKLLRFPCPDDGVLKEGIFDLLTALEYREHVYIRPTVYVDSTHGRGVGSTSITGGHFVVVFAIPRSERAEGIRCCVSSWRRGSDLTLSPRIKSGAGFQAFRFSLLEAAERGADEAILLNDRGTVAEATGATVFIVRDGKAATPPSTLGILEGITRRFVTSILAELDIPVTEREIARTELYDADEVFLCGTLTEIAPVTSIDGWVVGDGRPGEITIACRDRYVECCEAGPDAPEGWLTRVPDRDRVG
jgi:branched-chain amino acid aminotransferase